MLYKPMVWSKEVISIDAIRTIVMDSIKEEFSQSEIVEASGSDPFPLDMGFHIDIDIDIPNPDIPHDLGNHEEPVTMSDWSELEYIVTTNDIGGIVALSKWNYQNQLLDDNEVIDLGGTIDSRYMIDNNRCEVRYDQSLDLDVDVVEQKCCWIGGDLFESEPVVCYWLKHILDN